MVVSLDIDDAAAERVEREIDTSGDYHDIRKRLVQKYPKWSAYQRNQFAMKIVERKAFAETPKGIKETILEKRITLVGRGFGAKRQTMIRDSKGRYLGRPDNIKTYIRAGNVWGKNRLTGKSARLS